MAPIPPSLLIATIVGCELCAHLQNAGTEAMYSYVDFEGTSPQPFVFQFYYSKISTMTVRGCKYLTTAWGDAWIPIATPAQDNRQADCAGAGGKWTIFHGSPASCFNYEFIVRL